MLSDVLIGLVLANLFGKKQEPAVRFSPQTPPVGPAPAAAATAPQTATPPVFPAALPVPPALPPEESALPRSGMKRAVEVWQVAPAQVSAASTSDPKSQQIALRLLESQFPKGWQPVPQRNVTAAEVAEAKSLLGQWHDGGVVFSGGNTPSSLRAFRMTQHPATASPAAPARPAPIGPVAKPAAPAAPQPVQAAPAAPQGGSSAAPAPASSPVVTTIPEVVITATPPSEASVTTVRRGEGLAQVAKRLGQPPTATSAKAIRDANVPNGPDAQWSVAKDGNLKKAGRAGGLQPGDRLFVPPSWGAVDAARL